MAKCLLILVNGNVGVKVILYCFVLNILNV